MTSTIFPTSALLLLCFTCELFAEEANERTLRLARDTNNRVAQTIDDLGRIAFDDTANSTQRHAAIILIRRLNATTMIASLLRIFLFEALEVAEVRPLAKYPAAETLAIMGSISYREIWPTLQKKQSDRYLYVLAFTMIEIDGKSLALHRTEEKLAASSMAPEQENLRRLLAVLREVDVTDPSRWP